MRRCGGVGVGSSSGWHGGAGRAADALCPGEQIVRCEAALHPHLVDDVVERQVREPGRCRGLLAKLFISFLLFARQAGSVSGPTQQDVVCAPRTSAVFSRETTRLASHDDASEAMERSGDCRVERLASHMVVSAPCDPSYRLGCSAHVAFRPESWVPASPAVACTRLLARTSRVGSSGTGARLRPTTIGVAWSTARSVLQSSVGTVPPLAARCGHGCAP